jgi:V-type H+-transporting ATPase subunit E
LANGILQVQGELKKMESFITKEAEEKAKEIRVKADEEYEIEKASIVRSEINAIDAAYQDKFKKASLAQQITKSTISNKTRLKVLATREEALETIFAATQEELKKIAAKKGSYKTLLAGLIEECLYSLMESSVVIKVRESDVAVAKEAAEVATENFEKKASFAVKFTVDDKNFLSKDLAGGVIVTNDTGRISVNNTLDERLKLVSESALPAIKLEMFGPSQSRKFFD